MLNIDDLPQENRKTLKKIRKLMNTDGSRGFAALLTASNHTFTVSTTMTWHDAYWLIATLIVDASARSPHSVDEVLSFVGNAVHKLSNNIDQLHFYGEKNAGEAKETT